MAGKEDPYRYRPLAKGYVRLFTFDHDVDTQHHEAEHCQPRLATQDYLLEEAPPYIAVSYNWGSDKDTYHILLNGTKFKVHRNLWWCLQFMCRFCTCTYCWADAICIDQYNNLERNAQVRHMGNIYAYAMTVVVWLGNDDDTRLREDYKNGLPWPHDYSSTREDEIVQHPYWSRMWIIQELLHARKIEILYGRHVLTWKYLMTLTYNYMLGANLKDLSLASDNNLRIDFIYSLPFLNVQHRLSKAQGDVLAALLYRYRKSRCADIRDRLFALLSLLSHEERQILAPFFPDYTMSPEKVVLLTIAYLHTCTTVNLYESGLRVPEPIRPGKIHHISPASLGLDSGNLWRDLVRETEHFTQFRARKHPKLWTWKFLVKYLAWNRCTSALEERRQVIERMKAEQIARVQDALHTLSVTTLR